MFLNSCNLRKYLTILFCRAVLLLVGLAAVFIVVSRVGVTFALLVVSVGLFALICLVHPIVGVVSVLGFAFINPSLLPVLAEFSEFSLRYVDIPLIILMVVIWIKISVRGRVGISKKLIALSAPLLPFLAWIGMSTIIVSLTIPNFWATSLASYIRLVETALFSLILYLSIREPSELEMILKMLIVFSIATVVVGAWETWQQYGQGEIIAGRYGGLLGINSLGLVSGLLIIYAFLERSGKRHGLKWMIFVMAGALGLFLSRSISSILAVAGALTLYFIISKQPHKIHRKSTWKRIFASVFLILLAGVLVWYLRTSDVRGLLSLSGGSLAQRLMIIYAGFFIFINHPLAGVGWQASATETIIGDPELNAVLMEKFPQLPQHYFFIDKPTSLHNFYIQILAELGLIGATLFIFALWHTGKAVARIVENIDADSPHRIIARFCMLGLVFLLLWWNTNPLYGGQIETVLAFSFLTLLARAADFERQRTMGIGRAK